MSALEDELAAVVPGSTIPTRRITPLLQDDVLRFAGASGDFNPLHWDPAAAERAGFDAPIAMGQLTAALIAGAVTDWCGIERLREFEIKFAAPVLVGNEIIISGEVESIVDNDDGDDGTVATVRLQAATDSVVTARATAVIRL